MTIYIDNNYKCHMSNDGTMQEIETDLFDGKCDSYIEGYCYEKHEQYTSVYPWKLWSELDDAQRDYEREQLAAYEQTLSEIEAALGVSG